MISTILQSAAALIMSLTQPNGDTVPDFSRVGYRWGDKEIPEYKVVKTIEAPADGSDATELIQGAIDGMRKKGAILLKEGIYNISGTIHLNKSFVVLRGESKRTVINATGTEQRTLIMLGEKIKRVKENKRSSISAGYTPVGQMYVEVEQPEKFAIGDHVLVCYDINEQWIHDIKMDQIPMSSSGNTKQWETSMFKFTWERVVTDIDDNKVYFDNPIVQGLDPKYGNAYIQTCTTPRIYESGIENMTLTTDYDPSVTAARTSGYKKGQVYQSDENHAWTAIVAYGAEHSWIRNVDSRHFAFGLAHMHHLSKNITIEGCNCYSPKSVVRGSRRYAFHVSGGELHLFKDCTCEFDRHGFATGAKAAGPSVYLNCTLKDYEQDVGPHLKWATGFLYDNVVTDGPLAVQDGTNGGNGHGWRGANFYLWNCTAEYIVCQSPWASAKNYAVGCVGPHKRGMGYKMNSDRPKGVWVSEGVHVDPQSLYLYQLEQRKQNKIKVIR